MRIRLRAEHFLGLDQSRHISLSELARAMGITRHQLMHLLDNDSPHINRKTLEAVCEYLVGHGRMTTANMFQRLFMVEPDSFWPMLAARQRIDFFMGVRWQKELGWDQQIVAADSVLQSVMVNRLTGVAAEHRTSGTRFVRHAQQVFNSQLVLAWGYHGTSNAEIQTATKGLWKQFVRENADKSIVCLGSIKSNPMCDPVVARAFHNAKEFRSEDNVAHPRERHCPFVMVYREGDPHPPSCWGGVRLSKEDKKPKPGVWYECEPDRWEFFPWSRLEDVALVYYHYEKGPQNLAMMLGGFSGRSTRCLAEMLRTGAANDFWPPAIDTNKLSLGVFLVKFGFRPRRKNESIHVRSHDRRISTEVISLTSEVLTPRLAKLRD